LASRSPINRIAAWATTHPITVLIGVGLLVALSLLALRRLELGGSIYDLFPRRAGPVADLADYTRTFGGQEELLALISGPDAPRVERATRRVAAELERSSLVRNVRASVDSAALAELLGPSLLLLAGAEAWPEVRRRLTVDLPRQVSRLRQVLLSPLSPDRALLVRDPLLLSELILGGLEGGASQRSGLFASRDGRAALVFAEPVRPSSDGGFRERLQAALSGLSTGDGQVELRFTGAHLYAYHMSAALQRDLTVSSVLAILGVALVQLLFFRSLRLLPLSALVAGVALCWTLALAALTVGHLNALSLAFAALFIGMSDDVLIHITAATRQFFALPPAARMQHAIARVAPALIAATLTTVTAFLSFGLSVFAGLVHTGLLAACGLAINLLLAVTLFAAAATLLPPGPGRPGTTRVDRALDILGVVAQRRRWGVLLVCLLLGGSAAWAARGLRFSEDLTRLTPTEIPPAQADRLIAQRFERDRNRLIVLLQGRDTDEVLLANDRLAARMEGLRRAGVVASYVSLSRLLPSVATQRERVEWLRAANPADIARALGAALDAAGLRREAFAPFFAALTEPRPLRPEQLPRALQPLVRRQLARVDGRTVVATVLYPRPDAGFDALARSAAAIATPTVEVRVTGAALAGAQMARLLRRDLLTISLSTLAAVLLLLALLVRRLWPIVATVISLLLAGALFVGSLRLLGLPVDVYNLMVIPIIIGYGVDDHLYLMHRTLDDGIQAGVVESGRPVLAATLTTIAAFAALGCCQVPGLRTLGLTGVLGLGLGMLASLVVLPALLALSPSYRRGR
jgi:predicted RND superfamily exporter protein